MRNWARRWRPYLILAPLILVLGFAYNGYEAVTGNDDNPTSPEDVPKGQVGEYQGLSIRLTSLKVQQPASGGVTGFSTVPKGAVVVVAKFRGRIDDPAKTKKIFCTAGIENEDGWEWETDNLGEPYVPEGTSTSCLGDKYDSNFDKVLPKPHQWYEFTYGYYVPKERARGLRPTISYYREYPRYLRFES